MEEEGGRGVEAQRAEKWKEEKRETEDSKEEEKEGGGREWREKS